MSRRSDPTTKEGTPMRRARTNRIVGAIGAAAVFLGLVLAVAGPASPAAAATVGTLSVNPSTGTSSTPMDVTTSESCPVPATNVIARITGGGFGAGGRNIIGNTDAGVSNTNPFNLPVR